MAKIHSYLLTLIVLILLFHFAGYLNETGTSYLLDNLGITNPQNIGTTTWWATMTAITTLTIVGVTIGLYYGKGAAIVLLPSVLAIASLLFLIGWDLIALFNILLQTNTTFATLIISPLIVIYVMTVVEWIRGMST